MPNTTSELMPTQWAAARLARRAFLRYSGAGMALGGLWLGGCKDEPDPQPTPTPPSISGFTPSSGAPGTAVTLSGSNLGGATAVTLGGVAATFSAGTGGALTVTVPTGASTGPFVVTTPAGTATSSTNFTVLPPAPNAPTLASFTPASALPGATISLTGTNLTGATSVTVGGVAAQFTVVSATSITFAVPASATTGPIAVTTPGGTAVSGTALTVLPIYVSVGSGAIGVLNYLGAVEQVLAAFFAQLRTGTYYTGLPSSSAERALLDDLYYHDGIHRDFLRAALTSTGTTPIRLLEVDFASIDFNSRSAVLTAGRTLKDMSVAAYNGSTVVLVMAGATSTLQPVLKMASVEARHAALTRDVLVEGSFVGTDVSDPMGLEYNRSITAVATQLNGLLRPGSKIDVSGIL